MAIKGGASEFVEIIKKFKDLDGKIVGEDGDFIKEELAKSDRRAWINHLADQHIKKEKMDTPPVEFNISIKDVVNELTRREINKIFGQGT